MAKMAMCQNGSAPKMNGYRQKASDTFILKFGSI